MENRLLKPLRIQMLVFAVLFLAGGPRARAGFIVDEWSLATGIHNSVTGETVFDASFTVENPFIHSHDVVLDQSTASSAFDFAWSDDAGLGSFLIDAAHQAQGVDSLLLTASSTGRIWITPTEDLSLSIDAAYSYNLGADPMLASLSVSVFATDPFTALFDVTETADSFFDPPVGTLSIAGDIILPSGRTWAMRYNMELITWGDTVGHFATGSGFVDFQITPEPSTLCLLAMGILGLLRRRLRV